MGAIPQEHSDGSENSLPNFFFGTRGPTDAPRLLRIFFDEDGDLE
jgi:hypothetical protein